MTTEEIGKKVVELCRAHKNVDAVDTLLSDEVVSEEAIDMGTMPRVTKGKQAVRDKNTWWIANNEVHQETITGPFPNGDEFAVVFAMDFTPKNGPMAGKRISMTEVGVYSVKNDKIVKEKFFYTMG